MGRRKTRKHYVCQFCGIEGQEHFTHRTYYECRSCRAERSKDIHWREFIDAMERQKLAQKFWKAS